MGTGTKVLWEVAAWRSTITIHFLWIHVTSIAVQWIVIWIAILHRFVRIAIVRPTWPIIGVISVKFHLINASTINRLIGRVSIDIPRLIGVAIVWVSSVLLEVGLVRIVNKPLTDRVRVPALKILLPGVGIVSRILISTIWLPSWCLVGVSAVVLIAKRTIYGFLVTGEWFPILSTLFHQSSRPSMRVSLFSALPRTRSLAHFRRFFAGVLVPIYVPRRRRSAWSDEILLIVLHIVANGAQHLRVHHALLAVAQLDTEPESLALEVAQIELRDFEGADCQAMGHHSIGAQLEEKFSPCVQVSAPKTLHLTNRCWLHN